MQECEELFKLIPQKASFPQKYQHIQYKEKDQHIPSPSAFPSTDHHSVLMCVLFLPGQLAEIINLATAIANKYITLGKF